MLKTRTLADIPYRPPLQRPGEVGYRRGVVHALYWASRLTGDKRLQHAAQTAFDMERDEEEHVAFLDEVRARMKKGRR